MGARVGPDAESGGGGGIDGTGDAEGAGWRGRKKERIEAWDEGGLTTVEGRDMAG